MKKLVVIIALAVAGLAGFNYATTGELKIIPSFSKSDEERAVRDLEDGFAAARKQFAQAHRTAAVGGIDTSGDADSAIQSVKQVKRELEALIKKLSEDGAKRKADDLVQAVREFEKDLR